MKIFIICSVRGADEAYREKLEIYVDKLEDEGHIVHLPHRNTNQKATGLAICTQNMHAIKDADEIHIFYNPNSKGTHFDMGVSFGLNKKIKIIESVEYDEGKSFSRMLDEWEEWCKSWDELK